MKFSSTLVTLITIGVCASQVAASQLQARFSNALGGLLLPRQSSSSTIDPSDIPTECQSQCDTIVNSINTCTTDSCICTTDNADSLESCLECLVELDPDDEASAEQTMDDFNSECDTSDVPTVAVTTPSEGGAGASATVAAGTSSSNPKTTTSAASAGSTSPAKGLNGAVSGRFSMTTAVVGVLSLFAGVVLL